MLGSRLLCKDDPIIPVLREAGERFYVTEENPTAEHIARLIFEKVEAAGYPVAEVVVEETDSCLASYQK